MERTVHCSTLCSHKHSRFLGQKCVLRDYSQKVKLPSKEAVFLGGGRVEPRFMVISSSQFQSLLLRVFFWNGFTGVFHGSRLCKWGPSAVSLWNSLWMDRTLLSLNVHREFFLNHLLLVLPGVGIKLNCSVLCGKNVQPNCEAHWTINGQPVSQGEGYNQTQQTWAYATLNSWSNLINIIYMNSVEPHRYPLVQNQKTKPPVGMRPKSVKIYLLEKTPQTIWNWNVELVAGFATPCFYVHFAASHQKTMMGMKKHCKKVCTLTWGSLPVRRKRVKRTNQGDGNTFSE